MQKSSQLIRSLAGLAAGVFIFQTATAATVTWSGGGANDFWSTGLNWIGGTPDPANAIMFDDTDSGIATSGSSGTPNNISDASVAIQSLKYGNTNGFHTTQIPLGSTLTVNGSVSTNVYVGTGVDNGGAQAVYATVLGAGSLVVTNPNGVIMVIQGSATSGAAKRATLDLEGLNSFTAYTRQIRVGAESGGSSTPWFNRGAGTVILAKTNHLFLASPAGTPGLFVAEGSGNSAINIVRLGQTNAIFSDAGITVGGRKADNGTTMTFNSAFTSPTALFRNFAGTGRQALWAIGDNSRQSGSSSSGCTGVIDFSGGTVDAQVTSIFVGRGSGAAASTGSGTGTLTFEAGTIDVNTLEIGYQFASGGSAGIGTVNVNGSALLIANTSIRLGNLISGAALVSGTLNINGGTVRANSITNGGGSTVAITLSSGTLALTNAAGSAASPILNFSVGDSILEFAVTSGSTNVVVGTLTITSSTNNTIKIPSLPIITGYPAQYPLIKYASYSPVFSPDFLLGSLPAGYAGFISNNVANSSLDLVITSGPITIRPLVWNGLPTGDWNTSTANWLYLGSPTAYSQADFVTFDDSANGSTTVNLTTSLTPGTLTISNLTKPYTFNGSGSLGGAVALIKDGASTLTIANSGGNTFSNGVNILGGTVRISGSADRLPTTSVVTIADVAGATLDLNNLNQTVQSLNGGGFIGGSVLLGSANLTDSGGGTFGGVISGSGQLIKTNFVTGGTLNLTNANTYTGGTVIGGYTNNTTLAVGNLTGSGTGPNFVRVLTNGTLTFGVAGAGGSVAAGVITNDGTVRLSRTDEFVFTNLIVGTGVLQMQNTGTAIITGTNGYTGGTTINPGVLRISNPGALGSGAITIANSAPGVLQLTNGITVTNSLFIASKPSSGGAVPNVENVSGTNTLTGPMALTQNGSIGWLFYATEGRLNITGAMTPLNSSLTSQNTTRNLWLRGDAVGEWSGNIIDPVGGTTNLSLRKDGLGTWILSGANTYTAPTIVSNGTLLVNGSLAAASAVTIVGGTLGGTGTINGPVVVNPEGTLAPDASIGTLTVNNDLTLNGITIMEVSSTGGDQVTGINNLTMGGTLQVVVNGPLGGYEVFKLFAATNYLGDFTYDLPTLPSPLAWSNSIAVDGTLRVTGGTAPPPQPTIGPVTRSGTNLVVTVPTVSGATYVLQTATNLTPTIIWRNESTNVGTGGNLPLNVPIDPASPRKFVRVWVY